MAKFLARSPHARLEYNLWVTLNDFFIQMGFDPEVYRIVPSYGGEESNKGVMILDLFVDDPDQELPLHTLKINLIKHKKENLPGIPTEKFNVYEKLDGFGAGDGFGDG